MPIYLIGFTLNVRSGYTYLRRYKAMVKIACLAIPPTKLQLINNQHFGPIMCINLAQGFTTPPALLKWLKSFSADIRLSGIRDFSSYVQRHEVVDQALNLHRLVMYARVMCRRHSGFHQGSCRCARQQA